MKLRDQIERLLKEDEKYTAYRIAKDTGVPQATITNLRQGKRKIGNLTLDVCEKLGEYYAKNS